MLSALKFLITLAFYGAVGSAPVVIHEEEVIQLEKELELHAEDAVEVPRARVEIGPVEAEVRELKVVPNEVPKVVPKFGPKVEVVPTDEAE